MVRAVAASKRKPEASRLSAEAWEQAALEVMAREGLAAVAVEPLARALGVTKGSFYWHFTHRDALVEAALRRWRRQSVEQIISEMEHITNPRERLQTLVARALREPQHGRLELTLAGSTADPLVARAFKPALRRRLEFLTRLFAELGFPRASARRRALIAYALFAGLYQLFHVAPDAAAVPTKGLIDELVASLIGGNAHLKG